MYLMTNSRDRILLIALWCVLSLAVGCGRQTSDSTGSMVEQTIPFHPDSQAFEGEGASPAVPPDAKVASVAPFHSASHPAVLPTGSLLTVQLPNLLSAHEGQPGDAFSASVAAPFTIGGKTLVERGTPVEGRIESVRLDDTNAVAPRGYFRLTLNSITIGGKTVGIHTLSLYTRASVQPSQVFSHPPSIRIQKGRRLTFRLTAPVTLDSSIPAAGQLSSGSVPTKVRPAQ